MADINGVTLSAGSSPTVFYTITYTKSRPNNSQMIYNFTISAALQYPGSYIGTGYALACVITINGSAYGVRIKQEDNDNWSGTTPRIRYLTVTCTSTTGNALQGVRFHVYSDGQLPLTSGTVDNSSYTVLSSPLFVTACAPPTAFALSATLAEGSVVLSWSGASGGSANSITGYEIESSESTNNINWGSWVAVGVIGTSSTSGSINISPPLTRGNYLRFRIRVQGTAGSSYYSNWKVTSNSVRKNILATPPTSFTASPTIYFNTSVSLNWSGTATGTSAIKNYIIQQSTSADNSTWSTWDTVTTVITTATSGSYTATPSAVPGIYTRYRIAVTDSLDAVSSYVISNTIRKNTNPPAPTVTAPKAGSITYNTRPRYLIQTGIELDGDEQTVYVLGTGGSCVNSVDNVEYFNPSGTYGNNSKLIYTEAETAHGTYTVRFEARDTYSSSNSVNRTFTVVASPFEEIIANETHVKASHILTIRTAVNSVRNYYGMTEFSWSSDITSGVTEVRDWVFHILEIRSALNSVIELINSFSSGTFEVEWIPLTTGRPKADVMEQIHEVILGL